MQEHGAAVDARPAFTHAAFGYDSDRAYGTVLSRFIRDGLARDETVAVAADAHYTGLLRDTLGGDATQVRFLPAEEWYVRPVRTIAGWSQVLRAAAVAGRPAVRLIGHTPLRADDPTWLRYESALNASLAGLRGQLLCPYDRTALPAGTVARLHPHLYDDGWVASAAYEPPEQFLTEVPEPWWPVMGAPALAVPVHDTVAELRTLVRTTAADQGWLPPEQIENLLLALSEVATNGIRHGGDRRELRVWVTDDAVVCEVTDDGAKPPDPLAGYLPPRSGVIGGMGLWLVQQLCDAMTIGSVDGLTRARFALRRSPA